MVGIVDLLGLLGAWDTDCGTYDIAGGDPGWTGKRPGRCTLPGRSTNRGDQPG